MMIKISCYQTTQDLLHKAFCQLAEKCYYGKLKTTVSAGNDDLIQTLDKVLWTYSKKHFIPHATNADPFPEKQPIYITNKFESYIKTEIIIFVNITKQSLLDTIDKKNKTQIENVQKILFLFDELQELKSSEICLCLKKSYIQNVEFDSFMQTKQGLWQKILIS